MVLFLATHISTDMIFLKIDVLAFVSKKNSCGQVKNTKFDFLSKLGPVYLMIKNGGHYGLM